MTINQARRWANAWLRVMRIYSGEVTRAINEDTPDDADYFTRRYNRAHARWADAVDRVVDMNMAATEAAAKRYRFALAGGS